MRSILSVALLAPLVGACAASGSAHVSSAEGVSHEGRIDTPPSRGELGEIRLPSEACTGVDLKPEFQPIGPGALQNFLKEAGFELEVVPLRSDLEYIDVKGGTAPPIRLRVATLDSAQQAGRSLHDALLEHGMGSWGVHRSNIAVLAAASDVDPLDWATRSKLACWGVLTVTGRDDTFVVPGGYREL